VELPRRRGPVLPFAPPPPLRTTLLHATFRVPVAELWSHLFSNSSAALVAFHERLGDTGAGLTPWRQAAAGGGGPPVRVLRFSTPVRNPMVSSPVSNREELTAARLAAGGFVVDAACTSAGAPFAASFVNRLQWAAAAEGGGTRLRVTGECNFVTPVWGPIKGTIERESIKVGAGLVGGGGGVGSCGRQCGSPAQQAAHECCFATPSTAVQGMTRAYAMLHSILAQRFGLLEAAGQPAAPPSAARPPLFDFARGQQMTPAVVAAFFAVVVLLWRMVLLDALALQALRRLVPSPGGRGG
jgi:hypothetical protein